MLRKLIIFAITSGLAKKLYTAAMRKHRTPFPTAANHLRRPGPRGGR